MKYKLISLGCIFCLLALGIYVSAQESPKNNRYYQHTQPLPSDTCPLDDTNLCSHLPIVEIDTKGQSSIIYSDVPNHNVATEIPAEFKVIDNSNKMNIQGNPATIASQAIINYRGNSSLHFDKKSYKVNFVNEDMSDHALPFLGMAEHDEWVLNGPFLDKTLLRNYIALNVSGEIMDYSVDVRYFELIVNGQYEGVYLAMESIDQGLDRVNIRPYDSKAFYTSYILRTDRKIGEPQEIDNFSRYSMRIGSNNSFEVIYPSKLNLTPKLQEYIEKDFSKFEKALYSYDYNERNFGYWENIDVNTFVDYMIINEFFQNNDAGIFSTYYYKDIRGKISIGPVWDFNNCLDNFMELATPVNGFRFLNRVEYVMLLKDDYFVEAVINRYRQLRKDILSEERLIGLIDDTVLYLGDAIDRNNERWGYSFDAQEMTHRNKLSPDERNLSSYDEALTQMKTRIIERGRWLDKNIDNLRQYCHESKVKKFNH